VGGALLTSDLINLPNLLFLLLAPLLVVIGGTRAAMALAILVPLFAAPLPTLFLISLLSTAAISHENSGRANQVVGRAANRLWVIAPALSAIVLLAIVEGTQTTISESPIGFALICLQTLVVVASLMSVTTRAPNGSSTWWLGLGFAPLLVPMFADSAQQLVSWLALVGAGFALHLGARTIVVVASLLSLISLFLLPTPPTLLSGLLFVLLLAILLAPSAKTRGVIALKNQLTWQLAMISVGAIWIGWSFWQAAPALSISELGQLITYVILLVVIAVLNRQLVKRRQAQGKVTFNSVMLVIGQLGRGGAEKQLVLLANSLAASGIETTLVSFHGGERRSQVNTSVNLIVLQEHPPERIPWLLTVASKLWFTIWRYQPQVLIAFLLHAYLASLPMAAISTNATRVSARRSLGIFKDVKWVLLIERMVNSLTNLVIANSNAVADYAIKQEGLEQSRIKVVYNVLPEIWYSNKDEIASNKAAGRDGFTVLNVANLIAYKGQETLVKAVAQVRDKHPKTRLRIVGDGPERQSVTQLANQLGVPLEILGFCEVEPETYQQGDVFVLSSTEEGMSNALMEAMAAGLPIVATDVGGNRETLGDGGLIVPANDSEKLAVAIESLIADEELAKTMGIKAQARAKTLFTSDGLGANYLGLIESLA